MFYLQCCLLGIRESGVGEFVTHADDMAVEQVLLCISDYSAHESTEV